MASPLIISTWSFGQRGNDAAWPALAKGGSSLDAVEKVCQIVDADSEVDSVGFGGLPDAAGRVSLDGCVMLSPSRCGSACYVRRFMHPVSIARRIMEHTGHIMLAGDGADAFAEQQGFMPADLLSADAQDAFLKWRRDHAPIDQTRDKLSASHYVAPRPMDRGGGGAGTVGRLFFHPAAADEEEDDSTSSPPNPRTPEDKWKHHDTVGVLAIDMKGTLAGACSTSGTPFKTPGRVGDSPIIGHGLYVDPKYGAATATGAGELIMGVCGSFLAVELMRRGATPLQALRDALQRMIDSYDLKPQHQVAMVALRPDGTCASAALRDGYKTSITTSHGSRVIDPDLVLLS